LADRGIQAIAICLLHSYRNPAHEIMLDEIARRIAPMMRVSLSSRVAPEIKEYERTSTTLCNAYIQARVDSYLRRLAEELAGGGFRGSFFMMQSSGGVITTEAAREFPVRILESGPAGGAIAAGHYGRVAGVDKLLSFDMGGTTAKLAVIDSGQPLVGPGFEVARVYRFAKGSGLPVRVPVVEMIEIGAGGGSIAWIDPLGLIRVGPESAGADPGPACYGRGGVMPTVTDADLLLGYLDPSYFLGGRMRLYPEKAWEAVARHLAEPLGIDVIHAAWGVHRLVNENMASAARVHLVERGKDPGAYCLFAFGGAGPVHACGVAQILGSPSIMVPFGAGVTSLSFEFVQGWYSKVSELDLDRVNALLDGMESEGREMLERAGLDKFHVEAARSCDMRYEGQGFEVSVHLPAGELTEAQLGELRHRFEQRYRELYGRTVPDVGFEVVNWRVVVQGPRPSLRMAPAHMAGRSAREALKGSRQAYFPQPGGFLETPVFDRYRLSAGSVIEGPAIIEERESTVVVSPGAKVAIDDLFNLVVDTSQRAEVVRPEKVKSGDG